MMRKVLLVVLSIFCLSEAQRFDSNPWNRPPPHSYKPLPTEAPYSTSLPEAVPEKYMTCGPQTQAYMPIAGMCDSYVQCINGITEEIMCPDGLRFNPEAKYPEYPCGYPKDITCVGRAGLQTAQPTSECPHQYGFFRTSDSRNCGKYRMCVMGKGYDFNCPDGLAYQESSYACDWADLVSGCDVEQFLGYTCPAVTPQLDENGEQIIINMFYKHPSDCRKYYNCNNGKPRLMSCPKGTAFDERSMTCEKSLSCV